MSAQRRLYRLRDEGKIAGVCAGIADYLDVDPVAVRLAAVLLAVLVPPAGLIGYIACWVIMPEGAPGARPNAEPAPAGEPAGAAAGPEAGQGPAAAPAPPGPAQLPAGSMTAGLVLISIGLFFLLINYGILDWYMLRFWSWRMFWPVALILFGLYLLIRSARPQRPRRVGPDGGEQGGGAS